MLISALYLIACLPNNNAVTIIMHTGYIKSMLATVSSTCPTCLAPQRDLGSHVSVSSLQSPHCR